MRCGNRHSPSSRSVYVQVFYRNGC
uniref:Uncharacterized protein n=1 Tax=Anguilla anguilla TaxID=7936 RepID=A0A0E9PTN3_ANGAN